MPYEYEYEYTVCEECATELQWLKQVGCVGDELIKNFEGAPSSLPSFPLLSPPIHTTALLSSLPPLSALSPAVRVHVFRDWDSSVGVMWCTVVCTTVYSTL